MVWAPADLPVNFRVVVGMHDACTVLTDEIAEDVYKRLLHSAMAALEAALDLDRDVYAGEALAPRWLDPHEVTASLAPGGGS